MLPTGGKMPSTKCRMHENRKLFGKIQSSVSDINCDDAKLRMLFELGNIVESSAAISL